MKKWMLTVLATLCVLAARPLWSVTLPTLQPSDIKSVLSTVASDFAFRPVQPAASFGRVFGLSAGIIGSMSSTSRITYLIGTNTPNLIGGALYLAAQIPWGIAAEIGVLPTMSLSGGQLGTFGGDIRWTFSDSRPSLPLDMALRGMFTSGSFSYSQMLSGNPISVAYSGSVYGLNVQASKRILFVFEPFGGLGFIAQNSSLSATGSTSLFGSGFSSGTTKVTGSDSSLWWIVGIAVHPLPLFSVNFEYDNMFALSSYLLKASLTF